MAANTILEFLEQLKENNNRNWFHENKVRYEANLKEPFRNFVKDLIKGLQRLEPLIQIEPGDAIFRINRDTRFSADKSPYKTNVGALISRYGKKNKIFPGFYFHLEPGSMMIGGGAYFLDKAGIENIRSAIYEQPEHWQGIIEDKKFREYFDGILGERNKRLPADYKSLEELYPEIANKQFYFSATYPASKFTEPEVLSFVLAHFEAALPVNDFLAKALAP